MIWRSIAGFVLMWLAWAALLTSVMAATAMDWTFAAVAFLFALVAAALIFAARKLTANWYSLLIAAAALHAVVALVRVFIDPENAGEQIVSCALSGVCVVLLWVGQVVARKRLRRAPTS